MLLEFKNFLEVHYQDLYSNGFEIFRKKYNSIVRNRRGSDLYIQFHDFMSQDIDKTPWQNPDHHDPLGIYAYPISYVINHPADIWYAQGAKNLRVLRNKARNPLRFQGMSEIEARNIIWKLGVHPSMLETIRKIEKPQGINKWAKTLLAIIQKNYDGEPEIGSWGHKSYPIRSGAEQSKILLKAGFDALIDTSRSNKQAVVNDREPEQICFLTRSAFDVIEVFPLRTEQDKRSLVNFNPEEKTHGRKLVAMILEALGDRLVSGPERGNFWSAKGKRIWIEFRRPQSFYTGKKMGEKRHREQKLSDSFLVEIKIENSEKQPIKAVFEQSEKFKDIVADMVRRWSNAEPNDNFQPDTKALYLQREKEAEDNATKERIAEEKKKEAADSVDLKKSLKKLAKNFKIDFPISKSLDYYRLTTLVVRHLASSHKDGLEKAIDEFTEESDKMVSALGVKGALHFGYMPSEVVRSNPALAGLRNVLMEMYKRFPNYLEFRTANVVHWAASELKRRN